MCVVIAIILLIPILSGYAIYLVVAALITEAPPLLQITVSITASSALFIGLRQPRTSTRAKTLNPMGQRVPSMVA